MKKINPIKKMYQTKNRIRQLRGILGKKNSQWRRDLEESQIAEMKTELGRKEKELKEIYNSLNILKKQKRLFDKLKEEGEREDD